MTTFARRLILLALGVLGGLAVWPVAEALLFAQKGFGSYLAFLAALGAVVGAIMGAFFGAAEGVTSRVRERIPAGMIFGADRRVGYALMGVGVLLAIVDMVSKSRSK